MESEPKWPEKMEKEVRIGGYTTGTKYNPFAKQSEYAGMAYMRGFNDGIDACIAAFADWLKEQKPIVLPEIKKFNHPHCVYGSCVECMGIEKWNNAIDEFYRLNPQIN